MSEIQQLKAKDFKSDQEIRWCPGCGDYSIIAGVQAVLADIDSRGIKRIICLGDIIGYSMVPDQPGGKRARKRIDYDEYTGPEIVPAPFSNKPMLAKSEAAAIDYHPDDDDDKEAFFARPQENYPLPEEEVEAAGQSRPRRPFRPRHRR